MIPDDPELRRALAARSGEPTPDFAARVRASLPAGAPPRNWMPAVAAAVVVVLCVTSIGLLVHARQAQRTGLASGPRVTSPTPTAAPSASPLIEPVTPDAYISAPSASVVWALVGYTSLYRSTDGGVHWQKRTAPSDYGVRPVMSFIDDREGWWLSPGSPATQCQEATAAVWHTVDGGATWQQLRASGIAPAQCKRGIEFVDALHGFVTAGDPNHAPTVYRTADGGKTWKAGTVPDNPLFASGGGGFTLSVVWIKRIGPTLYMLAAGSQDDPVWHDRDFVYTSADGGATWVFSHKVASGVVAQLTQSRSLEIDSPGQLEESVNGGQQVHPYDSDIRLDDASLSGQLVFADQSVGYLSAGSTVQRTADGGTHWSPVPVPGVVAPSPSPTPVASPRYTMPEGVQLIPAGHDVVWAYLTYDHVLFVSTDQGAHWDVRTLPPGSANSVTDFSFISAGEGWALVSGASSGVCVTEQAKIWHTVDGAKTWQPVDGSGIPAAQCKANLVFIDSTHAFMTSQQEDALPNVLRSVDGGRTWSVAALSDPAGFESVPNGFAFAAGFVQSFGSTLVVNAAGNGFLSNKAGSYVYTSTDGGAHWTLAATLPAGPGGVVFFSATRWVIFQPSPIQTFDAGKTWRSFSTDYGDAAGVASTFVFADAQVGYATVRGDFHRTVDGGAHWVMPGTPWSPAA